MLCSRSEIRSFTYSSFDFLQPCPWIGAVNHTAEKSSFSAMLSRFLRMSSLLILV